MPVIRRVAVGFDGSVEARRALSWAASLCHSVDASLRVVHVVGLLEEAHLTPGPSFTPAEIHSLASDAGLPPDRVELSFIDGSPADVLLRLTADPDVGAIDLLVLGSRGAGRKPGSVLGSTSLEVAERARVPVVVVP